MVDPALAELAKIISNEKTSESVRLQAIKDVLDRIGMAGVSKHEIDVHHFDTREELQAEAERLLAEATERAQA